MDERKLRLYEFMVFSGFKTLEEIPEPYQSELRIEK